MTPTLSWLPRKLATIFARAICAANLAQWAIKAAQMFIRQVSHYL